MKFVGGGSDLSNRHEALAIRLLEGGLENLDGASLAAAAAGLRDTAVLENQLHRARLVKIFPQPHHPPHDTMSVSSLMLDC